MKVGEFIFPINFFVMDMDEDVDVSLILGRPFMKTARVIIDIDGGKIKVRSQDDEATLRVFRLQKNV